MSDNNSNNNNDNDAINTNDSVVTIYLTVPAMDGAPRFPLELDTSKTTCTELRQMVSAKTNIPLHALKLIYRGRLIGDDNDNNKNNNGVVARQYQLEHGSVLHCMGKPTNNNDTGVPVTTRTSSAAAAVPFIPVAVSAAVSSSNEDDNNNSKNSNNNNNNESLPVALQRLRQQNTTAQYQQAVLLLQKILQKIYENPKEAKFRKLKKNNAAFRNKLGDLRHAEQVMMAAGFVLVPSTNTDPVYELQANEQAWIQLQQNLVIIQNAVLQAEAETAAAAPSPAVANNGADLLSSSRQAHMVTSLMSDPVALQNMMQNPMVQQMMQTDAHFQQMQPILDQMANDPTLVAHFAQAMQSPRMQQQLQQAMAMAGPASAWGIPPPTSSFGRSGNTPNASAAAPGRGTAAFVPPQAGNHQPMTEDELIAEAIRRSLHDSENGGGSGSGTGGN